jgi:hypothetical protein
MSQLVRPQHGFFVGSRTSTPSVVMSRQSGDSPHFYCCYKSDQHSCPRHQSQLSSVLNKPKNSLKTPKMKFTLAFLLVACLVAVAMAAPHDPPKEGKDGKDAKDGSELTEKSMKIE